MDQRPAGTETLTRAQRRDISARLDVVVARLNSLSDRVAALLQDDAQPPVPSLAAQDVPAGQGSR